MVQAQNDFLAAVAGINRAKSRVTITEIIEKQNRTLYESKAGRAARLPDRDGRSRPGAGRSAHRRIRARGGAQSACHSRQDRCRDRGVPGAGQDQLRDADLCAAVRHRRAAQDRSRPICQLHQHRHRRSGLHHRRSVDRVARRLCPRERGAEGPRRTAARFHGARLSEDDVQGEHRPRRRVARSEHPPPDGARDDRQQQRPVQARDVHLGHHLHRRGRQLARRCRAMR